MGIGELGAATYQRMPMVKRSRPSVFVAANRVFMPDPEILEPGFGIYHEFWLSQLTGTWYYRFMGPAVAGVADSDITL